MAVYVLGVQTDPDTADAVLAGRGLMPPDMAANVWATQGSYRPSSNYSADTHSGGGAIDISRWRLDDREWTWDEMCQIATYYRQVGFAAWPRRRAFNRDGTVLWDPHVHMERVDCGDASPGARSQWLDYQQGRNGLANRGPDFLTRAYVDVTWDDYLAAHPDALEDDEMDATQAKFLADIHDALPLIRDLHAAMSSFKGGPGSEMFLPFLVAAASAGTYGIVKSEGVAGAGDPHYNGNERVMAALAELRAALNAAPSTAPLSLAGPQDTLTPQRPQSDPQEVMATALAYARRLLPAPVDPADAPSSH